MDATLRGALIGAGSALLGSLLTGVWNYFNTRQQLKYQLQKEVREVRRQKLESLVIKLEELATSNVKSMQYAFSIRPPEIVDTFKLLGDKPYQSEISMIAQVYATEVFIQTEEYLGKRVEFQYALYACAEQLKESGQLDIDSETGKALRAKLAEFNDKVMKLSTAVSTLLAIDMHLKPSSTYAEKVKVLNQKR